MKTRILMLLLFVFITTLDTLYRGRVESNGELIEISEDGKSYFYLEFYEGQRIEFWARWLVLEYQTK
jgi:hypothetical protein